jgi:hypothetical protein
MIALVRESSSVPSPIMELPITWYSSSNRE